jgi:hypothetical protein
VGSKTFDGVWFIAWSNDHTPIHVHGKYAGVELVIELAVEERKAYIADRRRNPMPLNAKKSDVAYILRTAAKYFDELVKLQEDS